MVQATVYLADIVGVEAMNEACAVFFEALYSARATFRVTAVDKA